MKLCSGMVILFVSVVAITLAPLAAQQTNPPVEFIESTSPLPGGGVVSSVYVPGRGSPVYRGGPATATPPPTVNVARQQSVLDPRLGQPVQPRAPLPANQIPAASQTPALAYPVAPVSAQIPNLGVPSNWNRSLNRTVGCNCGTSVGYAPNGTLQVVAQNPTIQTTLSPQSSILVQNLAPNAHSGRSLYGTQRQYVDGQPVRNLFRFVFP